MRVSDPPWSVSKTHLAVGQVGGRFWVIARFSANGTTVVGANGERRHYPPGRRVIVERGGSVECGEQLFLLF